MTNHNPTITSSNATGSFSENTNVTGSGALHALSGTMNFTDSDHSDTHTTSATLASAAVSGGTVIPAGSLAHFQTAMSSVIQSDSNGSGKLKWSFNDADSDFDFLAKNQTLTLTYTIKVSDNHGGSTTKTVTVTVTGTDDKPVITLENTAIVTEQANHTLSLSADTAHVTVHFTDADLANTGHTATVTGVTASGSTAGILPGSLGTAELMSFFDIDNVVKNSGSSNGIVNTTFSAPDLAFDYLAAGEQLNIAYTIQIDDHAGGVTSQVVNVTVMGTNDAPVYLALPDTAHLTEGQNVSPGGNLTAHGDFLFSDIDLSDTHSTSTTVTATRSGGGSVPLSNAALLAAMSTSVSPDSTNHILGDVDWNFAIANNDISFLSAGETLTLVYSIKVLDNHGGSDTETVTVTILGTNHPVAFTSGPELDFAFEQAGVTGSAAPDTTATQSLAFTDQDLGDTHTVAVTLASDTWSGGTDPAATHAALATALTTTLHDFTGTGTGSVDWSFSIPDNKLDFLAEGETLTVVYNVKVSDGPTSSTQTVTITATGANDAVVMTSGPGSASTSEIANTSGSSTLDTTSTGTLSFTDVDLSDMHSVGTAVTSVVWSFDPSFTDFGSTLLADLNTALMTALHESTGSGSGGIDWTFALPDMDVDFLRAGETLTVAYDVTVTDAATSSVQTVTITINGASDPLTVNPVTTSAFDTALTDAGNFVAFGDVITDAGDTGGDFGVTLQVTDVNGSAANVGTFVAGTYGSLQVFSGGFYLYQANGNIDLLTASQTAVDNFTFTVTDSLGRSETTTLTINVFGADDAAVVTSADNSGSITEDAGPAVIVNGGFETGTLAGWSTSGSHISAEFLAFGGEFGNYAAKLAPTNVFETLSQDIATTAGQHYILSFYVSGDAESSSNSMTVTWDGATVLATTNETGGFTHYTFDLVAADASTTLAFTYSDNGIGMYVDAVNVNPVTGPATELTGGTISFTDVETGDTHNATFFPQGDYVGTFSLDPVSEAGGSGSVNWHFTVNNADIQFLAQNQSATQTYTVFISDGDGATTAQDITVTLHGTNDAPTTVGADHVITNAGVGGGFFAPAWALTLNDVDPDTTDTLSVNAVTNTSGVSTFGSGSGVVVFDDGTLGGSLDYNTTDGLAVSPGSGTVTIDNQAGGALNGTSGNDILIDTTGGAALSGGGGNDVLIGNSGSHVLTGGSGDDIFAFDVFPASTDVNSITDFNNVTEHDHIAVSAAAFGGGLTPGMDASTVFESSGDDQFFGSLFHYDETGHTLYFSNDGTTASAVVVTHVQAGVLLSGHDLMIVT